MIAKFITCLVIIIVTVIVWVKTDKKGKKNGVEK